MINDIDLLKKKFKFLKDRRSTYDSLYRDLSDYVAPDRGFFQGEMAGQERTNRYNKLIDPSATISLDYFAAGLQAGMNSPARPWMRLQTNDPDKNKYRPFKEYFSAVERIIYALLAQSNFYTASHNVYLEQGCFGTACLLMEEDFSKYVRFLAMTAGEYWIDVGQDGKVNTIYRELYMTARNMVQKWGKDRVSSAVKSAAVDNSNPFQLFKVIQMIEPRSVRDITRIDVLNMAYRSVYFEETGLDILGESGFDHFPGAVPRWNVSGSAVYGSGPGARVLRMVKLLQEKNITKMKAEHQMVDPAVVGPESLRQKGLNTLPGGRNYIDTDKAHTFGRLFEINYDMESAIEGLNDVRQIIERCLYTDLFIMIVEKDDMTATEILERKQEKLFTLGPAIEKQTDEFLDPVIDFVYSVALRRGILPPPPEELQGEELEIEYISSLAQAQKLAGLQQLQAYISVGIDLAQVDPTAIDKLDVDKIMDETADITGIPPKCNRSDDDVMSIRQQRQQQQQMAMQEEMANNQAARMKDLAGSDLASENALTDLQRAMEG
jgi:hypothetical protein